MPRWGKKSGGEDDEMTAASGGTSPKKRKKLRKKKKSRDDDDEETSSRPKKETRIKKMRMRLFLRNKGGSADDDDNISVASRGRSRGKSPAPPSGAYKNGGNYAFGGDGGFQLDNVTSMAPQQGKKVRDSGDADANKKFRVKPYHAFPEPFYLNESELYNCMMAPSEETEHLKSYLEASSKTTRKLKIPDNVRRTWGTPKEDGRIGSLRVEVLGCVGLDRAKPEVSVFLVVGDCAFSSDIIQGARSPMWPNSAKRCAVFPVHHAYARLFAGVFDVRQRKNSEADHFCGRIVVDIARLRPDTEYDITFPLRASSFIYDRKPRGVVRLRFSLHWFTERGAIMSYAKRPKNPLAFSKQAKKQPTIPCGDPKTFRNVAVTVHGQDFPGKYTRGAFRATMREFNLYQQNIRFLFKTMLMDLMLYENPLMSLYLFLTSVHCVILQSVRLVPPYFVGWLIYMFVESYLTYNVSAEGHLGYRPLTVTEIFYGLLRDGSGKKFNFNPLLAKKRVQKHSKSDDGGDIELMNHREFPFSERFEYPKFAAADAIAPSPASKNKKGGKGADLRTARRLSIYVAPVDEKDEDSGSDEDSDGDSEGGEKEEGDDMMEQGDAVYDDIDSEAEEEDEELEPSKGRLLQAGKASVTRRIRVGPPQNSETSGRKVPPQVHISRVEHMLHKASKNISVEMVHFPPPHIQMQLGKEFNSKAPASDVISAKEKSTFDEFDRLLGFRNRSPNPILRITSSFLGPLMRMIRIVVYAVRMSFNLTTWRDPFLSFWVLCFLSTLAFVLFIFPWRIFFAMASCILLGPQNIAVRKFLERRQKEKEDDEKESKRDANAGSSPAMPMAPMPVDTQANVPKKTEETSKPKKKSRWGGFGSRTNKGQEDADDEQDSAGLDIYHSPRPPFYAHTRRVGRAVPRDVAVPYFRFKKDRFYDWPPDPTVSRATPMRQIGSGIKESDNLDLSMHKNDSHEDAMAEPSEPGPRGLRNRARAKPKVDPAKIDYGYG